MLLVLANVQSDDHVQPQIPRKCSHTTTCTRCTSSLICICAVVASLITYVAQSSVIEYELGTCKTICLDRSWACRVTINMSLQHKTQYQK